MWFGLQGYRKEEVWGLVRMKGGFFVVVMTGLKRRDFERRVVLGWESDMPVVMYLDVIVGMVFEVVALPAVLVVGRQIAFAPAKKERQECVNEEISPPPPFYSFSRSTYTPGDFPHDDHILA
jgi:hypothetical protein